MSNVAIIGDAVSPRLFQVASPHRVCSISNPDLIPHRHMLWSHTSALVHPRQSRYVLSYLAASPYEANTENRELVRFFQDAYIVGRLLTHPLTGHKRADLALLVYEAVRLRTTNSLVLRSRELGCLTEFDCPGPSSHLQPLVNDADGEGRRTAHSGEEADAAMEAWRQRWSEEVTKRWQWQWEGSPQENWKVAEKMLGEAVKPGVRVDAGVGLLGFDREVDSTVYTSRI